MAKHKAFVCVMYFDGKSDASESDNVVMLAFPKGEKGYHIVVRPRYVQANTAAEMRALVNNATDSMLQHIPGYSPASVVSSNQVKFVPTNMDELVISQDTAPSQPTLPGNDFLLDIGDLK